MQELDAEYKQRALSNLDNESKNALAANAKLQAELQMQTEGIEALMSKYKAMEKEYTKLVRVSVRSLACAAAHQLPMPGRKSSTTLCKRGLRCRKHGYVTCHESVVKHQRAR